jgi:hypothetical protein
MKPDSSTLKSLAWPTYFVALLLIAIPAMDYVTNVWPLQIGEVRWRYGSVGMLAGFLLTPLMGVLFAFGAAAVLQHRVALRFLAVLNFCLAVLLLVLIGLFVLDVLQVRGTVPLESRPTFDVGAMKAVAKCFAFFGAFAWFGIVGIRASRLGGGKNRRPSASDEVPLIRTQGSGVTSIPDESV